MMPFISNPLSAVWIVARLLIALHGWLYGPRGRSEGRCRCSFWLRFLGFCHNFAVDKGFGVLLSVLLKTVSKGFGVHFLEHSACGGCSDSGRLRFFRGSGHARYPRS